VSEDSLFLASGLNKDLNFLFKKCKGYMIGIFERRKGRKELWNMRSRGT
jgi:hypothetical protein